MRIKKAMIVLSLVCLTGGMMSGCGTGPDAGSGTAPDSAVAAVQGTDVEAPQDASRGVQDGQDASGASQAGGQDGPGNQAVSQEGHWHVLDPETAEAMGGVDFLGMVWKLEEDSFWIVETKAAVLEDGSTMTSSPSSNAEIPDSDLLQVVFDDYTRFYIHTIYNGGERYEDSEAAFGDLEEKVDVDLKGSFQNDVFHATEVQSNKIA